MVAAMKLLSVWCACVALAGAADLAQVRTVYILSMGSGLDQYLANRLTEGHVLQVVTDPKRADAVLTDHLGPSFEDQFSELYPPPPKPEPKKDKEQEKEKEKEADKSGAPAPPAFGDTVNKLAKPRSTFGRGKGTIFLVDVKTREVLWSSYEKPKDSTSTQLDRTAARIVSELKKTQK